MTEPVTVLEALPEGLAVTDTGGTVRWVNRALAGLAGRPAAAIVGAPLSAILEGAPEAGEARARLLGAGDGAAIPVLVSATEAADGGHAFLVRDLRPWSGGPPLAEADGAERALGAVFEGALEASRGEFEAEEDFATVAQVLALAARRLIPAAECLISVLEPERPGYFVVAGAGGPWSSAIRGRAFPLAGSLNERAITLGAAIETSDAQLDSALSDVLAEGQISTARVVPVVAPQPLPDGRRAIGAIGYFSTRRRPFTPHQRRLMDDFAGLVRFSLLRAELRRAARQATERLDMGVSLAADLGRTLQPREVVGRLLERLLDVVDCERAALLRIEGADTVTEDARDRSDIPDSPGFRHPVAAQPLMTEALRARRPVTGHGYRGELLPPGLERALAGIRHTLTVPLVLQGEPVAVLVLSRRRDAAFGPDQVAAAQLAGNIAVLALRNSWLFAAAEEASHQRSDFLNMAAHELRTPFTVVAGYLSMLSEGSFGAIPPAAEVPVATLSAKADELGELVEDLLIAARLDSGGMPVRRDVLDLVEAARLALDRVAPRAALLGADIELDAAEACPVVGDGDHVARILDNLLNNALSYSTGRPWVRVRIRRSRGVARAEVADNGRGIPEVHAGRIFERFYRVDEPDLPQQSGTGLGLFISSQLAERMNARLELEWTRPGEGSRFVLSLTAVEVAP